jgi:hypothetical protein
VSKGIHIHVASLHPVDRLDLVAHLQDAVEASSTERVDGLDGRQLPVPSLLLEQDAYPHRFPSIIAIHHPPLLGCACCAGCLALRATIRGRRCCRAGWLAGCAWIMLLSLQSCQWHGGHPPALWAGGLRFGRANRSRGRAVGHFGVLGRQHPRRPHFRQHRARRAIGLKLCLFSSLYTTATRVTRREGRSFEVVSKWCLIRALSRTIPCDGLAFVDRTDARGGAGDVVRERGGELVPAAHA